VDGHARDGLERALVVVAAPRVFARLPFLDEALVSGVGFAEGVAGVSECLGEFALTHLECEADAAEREVGHALTGGDRHRAVFLSGVCRSGVGVFVDV